ncbi:uncharacterized protein PFL1_06670 [Pseudozyma flocculosa PF-1]|uniref:Carboxypeptidase n=2 Tax=Pseudozyma flocculosa TaxID=84751 RepID=A0A5C3F9S3_9BASI|nr:uncharacterized protein PFL1_06670 [Pseudozyma flocculosa PF-1]EPQ25803.1 hypothetical protein PFL1_06670 [Pseudozyma flocculosa PF-1]SPO40497.1 probable serine-type carboxypeptidase f precursor [Pseudozyma flocculosa]
MKVLASTLLLASAVLGACARGVEHVGKASLANRYRDIRERALEHHEHNRLVSRAPHQTKAKHLNSKTKKFAVDGAKLPLVPFDIGESYAGLMPISENKDEERQLYFWYFPSSNPAATDEITIWLNGGPGCSSLEGMLQENGPFLMQYGAGPHAVPNPWSWQNLTNIVFVEQPVGTGFSQGTPNITSEAELAEQFKGFYKNFAKTFSLQNKKIYITGESYAGMYVPHIASAMLDEEDKEFFNVEGTMIYDPSINTDAIMNDVPAMAFLEYWKPLFGLNDTFVEELRQMDKECGFTAYLEENLVYPPKGKLPEPPKKSDKCDPFNKIIDAVMLVNPCWDIYQIATTCPLLWDVLGFPGSFGYLPNGATIYFDRDDVKRAINAPVNFKWEECSSDNVFKTKSGLDSDAEAGHYSSFDVLPSVIERSNRTVIAHGMLDYVLLVNGTLLSVQNMTWNGAQGLSKPVTEEFFVPYHDDLQTATLAGAGVMGTYRTERGLSVITVAGAGHMVPQYTPSVAYRQLEFLLGRIDNLGSKEPFTKSDNGLKALPEGPQKRLVVGDAAVEALLEQRS